MDYIAKRKRNVKGNGKTETSLFAVTMSFKPSAQEIEELRKLQRNVSDKRKGKHLEQPTASSRDRINISGTQIL